eukprot:11167484-Lingulodinium_polyedra.AAC.1
MMTDIMHVKSMVRKRLDACYHCPAAQAGAVTAVQKNWLESEAYLSSINTVYQLPLASVFKKEVEATGA